MALDRPDAVYRACAAYVLFAQFVPVGIAWRKICQTDFAIKSGSGKKKIIIHYQTSRRRGGPHVDICEMDTFKNAPLMPAYSPLPHIFVNA